MASELNPLDKNPNDGGVERVTLKSDLVRIMSTGGIRDLPDKLMSCYYVLSVTAFAYVCSLLPEDLEKRNPPMDKTINDFFKGFERERQFMTDPRWVRQTGQSWRPIFNVALLFFPLIVLVWMAKYHLTELFKSPNNRRVITKPTEGELILRQNPEERKEPAAFFFSSAFPVAALTLFVTGIPAAICVLVYNGLGIDALLLGSPSSDPKFFSVIIVIQFYLTSLCWCLSVLFFRSWFTFPLNFMSTEYDIAIYSDSVWQRPIKGWFAAFYSMNCDAKVIKWDELTEISIEGTTDFLLPNKMTEVPIHPRLARMVQSAKKLLNLHETITSLSRRRATRLWLISSDSSISICLDNLSQHEKTQLHFSIRNYAPFVHLKAEIQEALVGTQVLNNPRYTEIWFELMRREPLLPDVEIEPGKWLHNNKFQVIEKLKAGGEAITYLARDSEGRNVVLKRFQLAVGDSITSLVSSASSFENECALLSQLDCPGIVKLLDFFFEGNSAYLCVEHVEGATLRDAVSKGGVLSPDAVFRIATELCQVLEYLHAMTPPVVHRDFTPENIMLLPDGSIKVIDFSVAQQRKDTQNTDCAGKHAYTPPEQFRGQACPGSDIYALGGVIYFVLTGKDPTPLMQVKISEDDVHLQKFAKILCQATALELSERYTSVEWMKTDLAFGLTSAADSAP